MRLQHLLLLIGFVAIANVTVAQSTPSQPELESGTIESQFTYIIEKSSSFKDFQLIRKASILKVKANALDSLRTIRKELVESNGKVSGLNNQIKQLQSEVVTLKDEIASISEDKDNINFFGKNMDKAGYVTMMWIIVAVLLVALLFFIFKYRSGFAVIKQTKYELEKVENEYEEHRKKALKKEQEIMRKLQDEINKNAH